MPTKRTPTPSASQPGATTALTSAKNPQSSGSRVFSNDIVRNVIDYYMKTTSPRTRLIDVFMAFLVVVGAVQFVYCVLAGNYVSALLLAEPKTVAAGLL